MGSILGLLGLGGSGSSSYGNSNQSGPADAGGVTVNNGASNVPMYVLIGVLGFLGLIFLLRR